MYRQREQVRGGGAGYSTEVAGRDRSLFFRRPVEPSGGELHAAAGSGQGGAASSGGKASPAAQRGDTWNSAQVRYAASTPADGLPFHAGTGASIPSPQRHRAAAGRRPSSVEVGRSGGRRSRPRGALGQSFGAASTGGGRSRRAVMHHLPSLGDGPSSGRGGLASTLPAPSGTRVHGDGARDVGMQTVFRENEAQTDPYSPDYYVPDGIPEPEILKLQGLTYQNGGLPAGKEEVELIQRLRRRREVEAGLPTGNDDASIEERFRRLHELEEEECADREAHIIALQARRLDRIQSSLEAREAARDEANQARLDAVKQRHLAALSDKLTSLHSRSMADGRRAMGRRIAANNADAGAMSGGRGAGGGSSTGGGGGGRRQAKPDLVESYVNYGTRAAPPVVTAAPAGAAAGGSHGGGGAGAGADPTASRAMTYDVRPTLLSVGEGVEEVDTQRAGRIERVPERAFTVPEDEAIARLPTLYQRHEAERVVQSLQRAHEQIEATKAAAAAKANSAAAALQQRMLETGASSSAGAAAAAGSGGAGGDGAAAEGTPAMLDDVLEDVAPKPKSVLDLYRAPPKIQRPATPELQLDGDSEEEADEACVLLQRLLRGRAVQNDLYEGRERCRGLIQELQAASDAKDAEVAAAEEKALEELAAEQQGMVDHVLTAAIGDIIGDTMGFLYQELDRQRDARALEALQAQAELTRAAREAAEMARREEERVSRERQELRFAALVRATRVNVGAFLESVRGRAVLDTAMAVAVEAERAHEATLPAPRNPQETVPAEVLACNILDRFVLPAIVDSIQLMDRRAAKHALVEAAEDVAKDTVKRVAKEEEEGEVEE